MALPKRIAVTLPMGPKLEDSITLVEWAEANGFDDVWFSDAMAPDSLTMVAAVAPYTQRMRVGVAVTPVYTRTPAVFAATANVLGQLLPGRFVMGLGSSSQTISSSLLPAGARIASSTNSSATLGGGLAASYCCSCSAV